MPWAAPVMAVRGETGGGADFECFDAGSGSLVSRTGVLRPPPPLPLRSSLTAGTYCCAIYAWHNWGWVRALIINVFPLGGPRPRYFSLPGKTVVLRCIAKARGTDYHGRASPSGVRARFLAIVWDYCCARKHFRPGSPEGSGGLRSRWSETAGESCCAYMSCRPGAGLIIDVLALGVCTPYCARMHCEER